MEDETIISQKEVRVKEVSEKQKEIASGRFRGYYPDRKSVV